MFDVSEGYEQYLEDVFNGWEPRVLQIIQATSSSCGGVDGSAEAAAVVAQDAECLSIPFTGDGADNGDNRLPAVLIGDALHGVDPILAQGAGVGIEDADALAAALDAACAAESSSSSSSGRGSSSGRCSTESVPRSVVVAAVSQALAAFSAERSCRTMHLRWISRVSQGIAMADIFNSPRACNARDALLQVADKTVGRPFFEWSIAKALVPGAAMLRPVGTRSNVE